MICSSFVSMTTFQRVLSANDTLSDNPSYTTYCPTSSTTTASNNNQDPLSSTPADPPVSSVEFTKDEEGSRNKQRGEKSHWNCILKREVCTGSLVLYNNISSGTTPVHTHEAQQVELTGHRAKKTRKEQAVKSDLNPKRLAATCSTTYDWEGKTKLGCSEESLARMAKRNLQMSNRHPCNHRTLLRKAWVEPVGRNHV